MNMLHIPVGRKKENCIEVYIFSRDENESWWHHTVSIIMFTVSVLYINRFMHHIIASQRKSSEHISRFSTEVVTPA
jgi:hypothetical protein